MDCSSPPSHPGDGSARAVRRLARLAQSGNVTEATRLPTLRDQIGLFRGEFPEGFAGEKWRAKHRGDKARKRLKRHRDGSLAMAAKLGATQLDAMIGAGDWVGIHALLVEVLASTDLVPSAQLRKLKTIRASRALALALQTWLYAVGEPADKERHFNVFVRELGDAASWQIATSVAALVHPGTHTCVRSSSFMLQGKMLLSEFSVARRPNARDYRRLRHVAETVRRELEEAGMPAQDLLDVYDFMWLTLRPAARDDLLAVPLVAAEAAEAKARAEAEAAAAEAKPDVGSTSESAAAA